MGFKKWAEILGEFISLTNWNNKIPDGEYYLLCLDPKSKPYNKQLATSWVGNDGGIGLYLGSPLSAVRMRSKQIGEFFSLYMGDLTLKSAQTQGVSNNGKLGLFGTLDWRTQSVGWECSKVASAKDVGLQKLLGDSVVVVLRTQQNTESYIFNAPDLKNGYACGLILNPHLPTTAMVFVDVSTFENHKNKYHQQ